MKSNNTLNSQFPPMDSLFIMAPSTLTSLQKNVSLCSLDLPIVHVSCRSEIAILCCSQINSFCCKTQWLFYCFMVAQTVKRLPTMWEIRVRSLGREDPLNKEMATHSSILAWKIPWTEEFSWLLSMGSQRVRHD